MYGCALVRVGRHIRPWGVFVTTPVVDPPASTVQLSPKLAGSGTRRLRAHHPGCRRRTVAQVETPVLGESVQQTLLVRAGAPVVGG